MSAYLNMADIKAASGLSGVRMSPMFTDTGATLQAIAATKGIKFGATTPETWRTGAAPAGTDALFSNNCEVLCAGVEFEGTRIQNVEGVFTFTQAQAVITKAIAAGKKLTWSHLFYPANDMAWVNTSTVTAGNYRAKIDAHVAAVAEFLQTSDGLGGTYLDHFIRIDVTNELIDGFTVNPNGYRTTAWYTAAAHNAYVYMFQSARAAWPTMKLGLGQDELETVPRGDSYATKHATNFLAALTQLLAVGAPIDVVDAQGHFKLSNRFDAAAARAQFDAYVALGVGITISELDCRIGDNGSALLLNLSSYEYQRRQAERIYQWLKVILPYIVGNELIVWMLADNFNTWFTGEAPTLYSYSGGVYSTKLQYDAVRRALLELDV